MRRIVVCEGRPEDADELGEELRAEGWTIRDGWDVSVRAANERVACLGDVTSAEDAGRAVLAAVRGATVIVRACGPREVIDHLCDDLRRLGPLEHLTEPRPRHLLDAQQRKLLAHLASGLSLGEAAKRLQIARRTADRRLAAAREALGVTTTAEAILAARKLQRPADG